MSAVSAPTERRVSIAFVRSAVQALDASQRRAALAQAGIEPDALAQPAARVSAAAFARLWMAVADLLDDQFFGLDARHMKVRSFAMLCHALASHATVGAALRQAVRGLGLFFDDIAVSLRLAGGTAVLAIDHPTGAGRPGAADPDARRFAEETIWPCNCWPRAG